MKVVGDAQKTVLNALIGHVKQKKLVVGDLFKELCKGGSQIKVDDLKAFLKDIPEPALSESTLELGLARYVEGLSKLCFMGILQEFWECVKEVAITTEFAVKTSKTKRKLAVGEIIEMLEEPKTDDANGLTRMVVRSTSDLTEGYVTLKGNQGTTFLQKSSKPYYYAREACPLQVGFESSSAESSRSLKQDEVVEVLEGPRKEPPIETLRLKGKATKDGKHGWVTLKDPHGKPNLEIEETSKLYVVRQPVLLGVAAKPSVDSGLARRLEVGETFEAAEGAEPRKESAPGASRLRLRCPLDESEGWLTVSSAVRPWTPKYKVARTVMLLDDKGQEVRSLVQGELLEALDVPSFDAAGAEAVARVKVVAEKDARVGFASVREADGAANLEPVS